MQSRSVVCVMVILPCSLTSSSLLPLRSMTANDSSNELNEAISLTVCSITVLGCL